MSKIQKGEVKNPYGRAGKPQEQRSDGWNNILTSLGNKNDTSSYTKYSYDHRLSFQTLDNLYSGDGIAKRIVDIVVDDATRDFIEVEESLEKEYDRIKLKPTLVKCLKDARLYGGSICVALVDDGGEFDEPINFNRVKQLIKLRHYDRWQVSWTSTDLNNDPLSPNYGMPEYYQISPLVGTPYRVHVSRVFRFDGIQTPERIKVNNNGWCDSVLQGCFNGLMQYGSVAGYSANIVRDFIQVVLGVKGLSEMLRQGNDDLVTKRATIIDMTRSVANTVFIDSDGETYDKKASSVSGLDALWDKFKEKLSSETGIPQVKLFGDGIGGLSNGSNDTRSWYDVVQAYRDSECPPFIEWVNNILKNQIVWKNRPKSLEYSFPSLWTPSEAEYADIKLKTAQTDAIYFGVQAVDPEYIYHLRHQNGYFRTEIKFDEDEYIKWLADRVVKEDIND